MQVDANKVISELQAQRNQALDVCAAANARVGDLTDQLNAANARIAELEKQIVAKPAKKPLNTRP